MDIPALNMFCASKNLIFVEFSVVNKEKGMSFKDFNNEFYFYTEEDIDKALTPKPKKGKSKKKKAPSRK